MRWQLRDQLTQFSGDLSAVASQLERGRAWSCLPEPVVASGAFETALELSEG